MPEGGREGIKGGMVGDEEGGTANWSHLFLKIKDKKKKLIPESHLQGSCC
jgi:hypothetical protein